MDDDSGIYTAGQFQIGRHSSILASGRGNGKGLTLQCVTGLSALSTLNDDFLLMALLFNTFY